jgi:hypothetical protein
MFPVTGTLVGCDLDMFTFDRAEGDTITATVTPRNGAACPPGLSLSLLRSDIAVAPALTEVPIAAAGATLTMTEGCPTITLPASTRPATWFLQVAVLPSPTVEFPYTLTVDARRP